MRAKQLYCAWNTEESFQISEHVGRRELSCGPESLRGWVPMKYPCREREREFPSGDLWLRVLRNRKEGDTLYIYIHISSRLLL